MKWDIDGDFGKHLTDPALRIPKSHQKKVCKRSQGVCTCRYLAMTARPNLIGTDKVTLDFVCVKNTPLKVHVDREATGNPKWKAKGDNCDGFIANGKKEISKEAETRDGVAEATRQKGDPPPPQDGAGWIQSKTPARRRTGL